VPDSSGGSIPAVSVENLVMRYGDKVAVDGLSLTVERGSITAVLGPNGAGKTTTLETCEGYRSAQQGRVRVLGLDPRRQRRELLPRIGVMLQNGGAWSGVRAVEMLRHIASLHAHPLSVPMLVERLGLEGCGRTPYRRLSGGQQQRLALARALVGEPDLMLLDEPLSNLDAKLREAMRFELKRLQRELGLTAIYVTHDQAEALAMSNRIAVVNEGRIVQVGKPREVYERPASEFVAQFVGVTNLLRGTVVTCEGSDGACRVETPDLSIWGTMTGARLREGDEVAVSVRPECVEIVGEGGGLAGARNEFAGQVSTRAFLGDSVDHVVSIGKEELRNRSNPAQSVPPGTRVSVRVDHERVAVVPSGSGHAADAPAEPVEAPAVSLSSAGPPSQAPQAQARSEALPPSFDGVL
jgi:ABC-2 type transport system ATP-binding protein